MTTEQELLSGAALTVFRLNGQFLALAEELARPAGLTAARWQVLGAVLTTPLPVAGIARAMGITRQSVQRLADILVAEGLAEYLPNPTHRRAKLLQPTGAGLAAVRAIDPLHAVAAPPAGGRGRAGPAGPHGRGTGEVVGRARRPRSGRRAVTEPALRPFRVAVDQGELDDLSDRLGRARFTPDLPGRDVGIPVERVRRLADHWRHRYDWRRWEAELNRHPQFLARVDGVDLHHLHVRSPAHGALPLLLLHGWPMSVVEWLDLIAPLTEGAPAFDLVIPSIPGFGFSGVPAEAGWDRSRTARAFAGLMRLHGYDRYGVHGNDVGASIALELGRIDPEHVTGVHVTQVFSLPSGDPAELAALDDEDRSRLDRSLRFVRERGAYLQLQATQPQTLAHALADSPLGQLAWSLQLLDGVSDDYLLTNVATTWFTRTAGSSALTGYLEPARAAPPSGPTTVPVGVTTFDGDVFLSVRALAERDHADIVSWNRRPGGSHHPAHHEPAVLADDLRRFFTLVSGRRSRSDAHPAPKRAAAKAGQRSASSTMSSAASGTSTSAGVGPYSSASRSSRGQSKP